MPGVKAYQEMTDAQLVQAWESHTDMNDLHTRDAMLEIMRSRDLFPSAWMHDRERRAGLYPDVMDPDFATRLYSKTEFADLKSGKVAEDICSSQTAAFDTTAVQRLVARFLHPQTPYRGMLLDHGVGVGKTCSAITIAEMFLETMPTNRVIILCPQAIASGFRRTIFDADRLKPLSVRDAQLRGEAWESNQCTGMTYLRLAGNGAETDRAVIEKDAEQLIRKRYQIMGYLQFANWVLKRLAAEVPKSYEGSAREQKENAILHRLFSDHLIIIDEAHNLRDIEGSGAAAAALPVPAAVPADENVQSAESPVAGAAADAAEGKKLTPVLRRIVRICEGLRLVLMTATPMYNTAPEILFLLNILLLNDVKDEAKLLRPRDFFAADGTLLESAKSPLARVCGRYISYMRGENPASFPLRLTPPEAAGASLFAAGAYPTKSISRREDAVTWTPHIKKIMSMLPLVIHRPDVKRTPVGRVLHKILATARGEARGEGHNIEDMSEIEVSDFILNQVTQAANITYPDGSYGSRGWETFWHETSVGRLRQFRWANEEIADEDWTPVVDEVFGAGHLAKHAPKIAAIVESLQAAQGMCFVFSRFVNAGALPLAVALERAGWTRVMADGSAVPLLRDVPPVPRACAFCPRREGEAHAGHAFSPANYVLLTGNEGLTPDFKGLLRYANTLNTPHEVRGGKVKAILGSQITSEGLDLKCIRENHIMDGWYHLNRIEQVIGRAVRYCSHVALPKEEQNCLIYLHAVSIPEYETADLYAYRLAAKKSIPIGQVQRVIKIAAWDCLMNRQAIVLRGLPKRRVVDARGRLTARYDPHDQPYTSICDFQESCEYVCAAKETGEAAATNMASYRVEDARRKFLQKETVLRRRFRTEVALSMADLRLIYADIPWDVAIVGIRNLLDNPRFVVEREDGVRGTLHFQHGYVVFQPLGVTDMNIPLAMRYGRAFGRLPRFMELPRGALLATEKPVIEEVKEEEGPVVLGMRDDTDLYGLAMQTLREWETHLREKLFPTNPKITLQPPAGLPSGPFYEGWRMVYHRFQTLEGVHAVARKWWMDHEWTLEQRTAVLRHWVTHGTAGVSADIVGAFKPAEYFHGDFTGYQVVNTAPKAKVKVLTYCFFEGDKEPSACPSNLMEDVLALTGSPLHKEKDTGPVFGFLTLDPKEQTALFKTINKADGSWKGAQCFNTSNLNTPRERVTIIQNIIREHVDEGHPIRELMLDDAAETQPSADVIKKRAKAGEILHVYDLTQKQICPYMEFLLRWMNENRIGGKRWFLSMLDTARSM
jgi:hypothetical protein